MKLPRLFQKNQKPYAWKLRFSKTATFNAFLFVTLSLTFVQETKAQVCSNPTGWVGCSSTDFTNFGLNSTNNAATIEYDNIESSFHASVARQYNGTWVVWGEYMKADGVSSVLSPQVINSTNYPGLTGTVLKAIIGGQNEMTVLTTTGLFVVGSDGQGSSSGISSTLPAFGKINSLANGNTYQLPSTLTPADVKMMLTTRNTFGIVTCSGSVWVLSNNTNMCGAGSGATDPLTWYQVLTSASGHPALANVVAVRCCSNAMIALTSSGALYTWGSYTYLGNNTSVSSSRNYATQMTAPTLTGGATIKMIGATSSAANNESSYFVLASDGNLYSMGGNILSELGNFGSTDSKVWIQPRYSSTTSDVMKDIAWISPQDHDDTWSAINVINKGAHVWAWGTNAGDMLNGPGTGGQTDPFSPPSLSSSDVVQAVVTGGHTTLVFRKCNTKFGYVGHRINGSMGNGSAADYTEQDYTFGTAAQQACGAPTNIVLTSPAATFCQSTAFNVIASPTGGTFSISSGNATVSGNTVTPTAIGNIDVVYTAPSGCDVVTADTIFIQKDFGNLTTSTWPDAAASVLSTSSTRVWCGPNGDAPTTDCGTNTSDGQNNGLGFPSTVTALNTYTYTVTLNSNVSGTTGYYGLWFDWNADGAFTDLDGNGNPAFYSGSAVSTAAGPVVVNVSVKVPSGASANYAIRLIGSASPITSTMYNSTSVVNGEVEDYLKPSVLPVTLQSFIATKSGTNVLLNWVVDGEKNVKNYNVEFSKDGINFTTVGTLSANNSPKYSFVHTSPVNGLNYYRLKMIDIDGAYAYSNTAIANFNNGDAVIVYPNPTKGAAYISFTSSMVNKPATLKVSSIDGKVLMLQKINSLSQTQTLDLSGLPSAKYLISVTTDTDVTNKIIDIIK